VVPSLQNDLKAQKYIFVLFLFVRDDDINYNQEGWLSG